jgi:3-methyladenine DNA glycosylase AlkD
MGLLPELQRQQKNSKVMLETLAKKALKDNSLLDSFSADLKNASPAERGACMEILEYVTKEDPALAKGKLDCVIEYLGDTSPRVKWEAARILANVSKRFPTEVAKGVDSLLVNTSDKGTVVRWSAAFALTEIAKSNDKVKVKLIAEFEKLLKEEKSSGVKNIYVRFFKGLDG